jgi:hypothetical protein
MFGGDHAKLISPEVPLAVAVRAVGLESFALNDAVAETTFEAGPVVLAAVDTAFFALTW